MWTLSNTDPLLAGPPRTCRALFPPTKFSAEFNALIASLSFFWLVGASELKEEDVVVSRQLQGEAQ